MAKQATRRSTASPARKAKRAASNLPRLEAVGDGFGSAVTTVRRDGQQIYRAIENRFGRTSTISMLTVAGVGVAIGALLLGVASARSSQQPARSRR